MIQILETRFLLMILLIADSDRRQEHARALILTGLAASDPQGGSTSNIVFDLRFHPIPSAQVFFQKRPSTLRCPERRNDGSLSDGQANHLFSHPRLWCHPQRYRWTSRCLSSGTKPSCSITPFSLGLNVLCNTIQSRNWELNCIY